jgi:hypothetical protein
MVGSHLGLWALRVPFEHLGARVFPAMFSAARAHQAFDADGRLKSPPLRDRFEKNIAAFMDRVEAAKHYSCVKKAWFEFLASSRRHLQRNGSSTGRAAPAATRLPVLLAIGVEPHGHAQDLPWTLDHSQG